MQIGWNENRALLCGEVAALPLFSHENHGISYWSFPLEVARLSGAEDRVNVLAPGSLVASGLLVEGAVVEIEGEVRSFNNRSGQGSRLVLSLFAKQITPSDRAHQNQLELRGVLCKVPVVRRTPLGREICDLMLAVNRKYGRADYLPCIAWGSLAQRCTDFQVGDGVRIEGRFQSRRYTKVEHGVSQERTAYEISVMKLEAVTEEDPVES